MMKSNYHTHHYLCKHAKGNVRDYASINELTVLSNLETHNATMIREGKSKEERFEILKEIADYQMSILNEAAKIEDIQMERLKNKAKAGKLMLDE